MLDKHKQRKYNSYKEKEASYIQIKDTFKKAIEILKYPVRLKDYKTNGSDFITISGRFYGDKFNFPRFFNTKENSILLELKRIFIRHLVCYQTNRLTTQATNWYSITLLLLEYIL